MHSLAHTHTHTNARAHAHEHAVLSDADSCEKIVLRVMRQGEGTFPVLCSYYARHSCLHLLLWYWIPLIISRTYVFPLRVLDVMLMMRAIIFAYFLCVQVRPRQSMESGFCNCQWRQIMWSTLGPTRRRSPYPSIITLADMIDRQLPLCYRCLMHYFLRRRWPSQWRAPKP